GSPTSATDVLSHRTVPADPLKLEGRPDATAAGLVMPDVKIETPSAPQPNATSGNPLASLYKMSTTAGVGTQEYVAINGTSIAALILGVGSVVVVLSNILLVVPLAGVICALVAMRQIANSNGTQTGRGFAAIGLGLAALLGVSRLGWDGY